MATGSHRQRWPQRLWLEAVDTVRSRLGPGHCPQEADWGTPQPVDLGTDGPNLGVMWPLARARRAQLLTPGTISVLCDGGTLGAKGHPAGHPGRGARGSTRAWAAAGRASLGTQRSGAAAHCAGEVSWPWGRHVFPARCGPGGSGREGFG